MVFQRSDERNYHVFYQFIRGADKTLKSITPLCVANEEKLLLDDDLNAYRYLESSQKNVQGVNDVTDFSSLKVLRPLTLAHIDCTGNHGIPTR